MPKKAILINPASGRYIRDDRCQVPVKGLSSALRMPMDLAYMASVLEKEGWECLIRDYPAENKDWEDFKKDIISFKPKILIISTTTPTLFLDLKSCEIAKEIDPEILTIAKGAHFVNDDKEVMSLCKDLDIVVSGECELSVKEIGQGNPLQEILGIVYRKNGAIVKNSKRSFLQDMDILPFPARHLLNNSLYTRPDTDEMMTSIQTNKGCPAGCVYCLVKSVAGEKIASRSPEKIAEEMEICKKEYGIKNFYFRSDTFTFNKDWMIEVCKEIINKKMDVNWCCNSRVDTIDKERIEWLKKAGCWMIGFGTESGDQRILDEMRKGTTLKQAEEAVELCSRHGIKTYLFWVMGLPWEDEVSIKNTIKFAKRLKGDFAEFHIAYPFPGTEFYDFGLKHALFSKEDLFKGDVKNSVVRSFYLSKEEISRYRDTAMFTYYLDPLRIFRLLRGITSIRELFNYVRRGADLLLRRS
jgi:anaerobic magnesium-protoporphyrin IX monomethyl ester cyclase